MSIEEAIEEIKEIRMEGVNDHIKWLRNELEKSINSIKESLLEPYENEKAWKYGLPLAEYLECYSETDEEPSTTNLMVENGNVFISIEFNQAGDVNGLFHRIPLHDKHWSNINTCYTPDGKHVTKKEDILAVKFLRDSLCQAYDDLIKEYK